MNNDEKQIPKIGVVLINWKNYAERFLGECAQSLRALRYPKDKYRIYIVDNETTVETRAFITKFFPEAHLIPNNANDGWGEGNNKGIRFALQDGCEDVVLLNMDVVVEPDWLQELADASYSDMHIGIAQSKIYVYPPRIHGHQLINSCGNVFHYLGFGMSAGNNIYEIVPQTEIADIGYASGTSMYIKGILFHELGFFESNFFMYHDDVEFSLKAKLADYRVVLAPKSIVYHKYQFQRSIHQVYFMERNRFLVLLYFYKWKTLLLILPMFLVMEIGQICYACLHRWCMVRLKVYSSFLRPKNFFAALKRRSEIQNMRKMKKDEYLVKDFVSEILFQEVNNPLLKFIGNPMMRWYWHIAKKMIRW